MPEYESPKGYYYVQRKEPSTPVATSVRHSDIYKDPRLFYGTLIGEIKTLKPLCFTQNLFKFQNEKPTYLLQREGGKIVLPGSQLKGAIKTYMQALSESYDEEIEKDPKNIKPDPVNAITGRGKYASRLLFSDIIIDEKKVKTEIIDGKQQWSQKPEHRHPLIRLYSHNDHEDLDHKVRFEVLPTKTYLDFEILIKGLTKVEMGLLFLAMGIVPKYQFDLKIGRGKNLDMGSVRFTLLKFIQPKKSFNNSKETLEDKELDRFIYSCGEAYLEKANDSNKENLKKIIEDSKRSEVK
jgi:CRISPR/Cas system CSM-associated protein Csm3 (group 7 of RAMP superfamily)